MIKTCPVCGMQFQASKPTQIYCPKKPGKSRSTCAMRRWREKARSGSPKCRHCGKLRRTCEMRRYRDRLRGDMPRCRNCGKTIKDRRQGVQYCPPLPGETMSKCRMVSERMREYLRKVNHGSVL